MDSSCNIKLEIHHDNEVIEKNVGNMTNWNAVQVLTRIVSEQENGEWKFIYKDNEGDLISGCTDLEWNAALCVSQQNKETVIQLHPTENKNIPQKESNRKYDKSSSKDVALCSPSNSNLVGCVPGDPKCCQPTQPTVERNEKCCPTVGRGEMKCCSTGTESCVSNKCMPGDDLDDGVPAVKIVNETLSEYKYTNEALRAVALPLGAIGGGSIAISGDGGLRQWQINNKVSHDAHLPDSFFAIKVGNESVVLQSNTWYDQTGFKPAPYISDHVVPPASVDLLKTCPGVKTIEITAKYPVVEVDYIDSNRLSSTTVHLETWSPTIPLNSEASGAPAVVFDFHVTNNSTYIQEVSLLASLQNMVGWDAYQKITNEVVAKGYGGNVNSLYQSNQLYGIDMSNTSLQPLDDFNGHAAIMALKQDTDRMSTLLQYSSVAELWKCFTTDACLPGQGQPGVSKLGSTFNGAVNTTRTLNPGEKTIFTYVLAWYFPNRYKDWSIGVNIPNTKVWVGNHYAKIWKNITEVLTLVESILTELRTSTYKFRDALFNSTLPWELIDSAAGRISVLNSPCCMWHADGNFYAFEGCSKTSGCCPLNCTHVWNFEMSLALMFPDVERTMREIDLLHQITPHGVIPSRTVAPLELRRLWNTWTDYTTNPDSTAICVDGEIGTIFKAFREYKHGGTLAWLKKLWNPLKATMNHWLDVLDTEKNGLVYGAQPNTYDVATYGYNVPIGCLYLCGLRSMEEMGKIVGDTDFSNICHDRFTLGSVNLDNECFTNGKWYTQVVDPYHQTNLITDATLIGSLYGQWWAHLLGLGYLLPKEHIKSHIFYTYQRNYIPSFDSSVKQAPRKFCDSRDSGWTTGKWDEGNVPAHPLLYSFELAWSGVIYPFASLLLIEGYTEQGLDVLRKTRELYDGTRRSPWNEIECGDHYARPMSGTSLLLIASGQSVTCLSDGSVGLKFQPVLQMNDFSGFFITGTGWGMYHQKKQDDNNYHIQLQVDGGEVLLSKFSIGVNACKVKVSNNVDASIQQVGDFMCVQFKKHLHLSAGENLTMILQ